MKISANQNTLHPERMLICPLAIDYTIRILMLRSLGIYAGQDQGLTQFTEHSVHFDWHIESG